MHPLPDTLHALETALGETVAAAEAVSGLDDEDLLTVMATAARMIRRAEAVLVECTGQVQDRSAAASLDGRLTTRMGCRSVSELVQRATLVSKLTVTGYERAARGVHQQVAVSSGEKLPAPFPGMRAALIDGAVGVDGVVAVLAPLSHLAMTAGRAAHLAADEELAASARGVGVDAAPPATAEELRAFAQVWAVFLDQDGTEPRDAAVMRTRGVTLGVARDGVIPVRGNLLPEVAAQLQRIFDALLNPKLDGPRFTPTDTTDGDGMDAGHAGAGHWEGKGADPRFDEDAPADPGSVGLREGVLRDQADLRTRAQKQHDALATALSVAARSGELPTLGGAAPTLVVSVRAADLAAGTGYAHLDGTDQPVPIGVARHTACDGVVQRVLMDDHGRIVSIGTLDRVFNHHQRKAITLRDGGCIIPGCHIPAAWCEIHHVTDHALGGPTHTDNGVLLCWHHHRTLNTNGWNIRMHHGTPHVRGPSWCDPSGHWRPTTTSPTQLHDRINRKQ
ncbi:DUF222 domain-containing protein [Microbacterium sp. DT81.1]|uniref:HNH endonuclease signature motif containing protein n=1 Tax=Microbacterium sp. DT81.1 TaxID=3393413 RepID=UPI003CEBD53D